MTNTIKFYKGNTDFLKKEEENTEENTEKNLSKIIQEEINKIFSSSHLSFLLGAGCSMPAIPSMKKLTEDYSEKKENKILLENVSLNNYLDEKENNLEQLLGVLFNLELGYRAMDKTSEAKNISHLINDIKKNIFKAVNVDIKEKSETLMVYETFYKKIMYRENSLSKINVFTTNYDLFNEVAMDNLGIIFCNGFSGVVNRNFNPMTYNYAYAEKIGLSKDKYNVIDNYVYLYKLHGSINWVEQDDKNSLYRIKEVQLPELDNEHIMIYPTPMKQSSSFASPYSDLFREFQKKLMVQDNILVTIGYSFSDEHVNHIIYQALATIPKFRLIIFCYDDIDECTEIKKLKKKNDPRIWIINDQTSEEGSQEKKIADFQYIVENLFVELDSEDENMEKVMKKWLETTR